MTITIYCDKGRRHVADIKSESAWACIELTSRFITANYTWIVR